MRLTISYWNLETLTSHDFTFIEQFCCYAACEKWVYSYISYWPFSFILTHFFPTFFNSNLLKAAIVFKKVDGNSLMIISLADFSIVHEVDTMEAATIYYNYTASVYVDNLKVLTLLSYKLKIWDVNTGNNFWDF